MSLYKTARNFKKGVAISALIVFVYYLFILFIIPKSQDILDKLTANNDPANTIYGQLEPLKFSKKPINEPPPRYTLDTKDGKLPRKLPNKLPVYEIEPAAFSFQAGKVALRDAEFMGYKQDELITDLKADVYRWRSLTSGGILEIDTKSRSVNLVTNLYGKFVEYKMGSINEESAKRYAKELFTKIERFNDELYMKGTQTVHLGRYVGNNIAESRELPEAQLAQVDFFRSINNYPIYGPDPKKGLLSVLLRNPTKAGSPFNYPKVEANYWVINTTTESTYPIISVADAWTQVEQGNGVITNLTPKEANVFEPYAKIRVENIFINKIYLAYYETPEYSKYLQPIFVFEGKYTTKNTEGGDVTVFFPAVSGEFTKKIEENTQ